MEIISKRHPYKFYLTLILMSIFFLGIGSVFINASIRDGNDIGFLLFFIFVILTIYLNYSFIKNSSKIILNKKGILCKNIFYKWDELTEIKLTGKRESVFNIPSECALLTFNNLTSIQIFDDLYSNSSEMKYFIQEIVINKKENIEYLNLKIDLIDIERELFIPYKGNAVFSFRGIFMWGFILVFILTLLSTEKSINWKSYLFIISFSIVWFIFNSLAMNYFEISKKYFVVKNYYFFWKKNIFHITEIKEIVFESHGKQPNTLRLISKKFNSKSYPAGTLTNKIWLDMKTELESKNIIVRNECI